MSTIAVNVAQALARANCTDSTIQTYAESEVINWADSVYRTFRWNFARKETSAALADGANSIALAADYFRLNTVKIKDDNDDYFPVQVVSREEFDRLIDPTTEGKPYICAVLGSTLYFYYTADQAYTVYYDYWSTVGTLTNASELSFPDFIVEQVAYIAALRYDQIDTTGEDGKLNKMMGEFRRNMLDEANDGAVVPWDVNVHAPRPVNFY